MHWRSLLFVRLLLVDRRIRTSGSSSPEAKYRLGQNRQALELHGCNATIRRGDELTILSFNLSVYFRRQFLILASPRAQHHRRCRANRALVQPEFDVIDSYGARSSARTATAKSRGNEPFSGGARICEQSPLIKHIHLYRCFIALPSSRSTTHANVLGCGRRMESGCSGVNRCR